MEKQFINPPTLSSPRGYTHVVTVGGGGRLIFVAGQVALDGQGQLVGRGDLRAQIRQAGHNLAAALAAAGAKPSDVVKVTIYVVNYKPEDLAAIRETRAEILPRENPPASTLVGVTSLAVAGLMVEIEAIAVV